MITWLDPAEKPLFPDTSSAMSNPNGLLAAGGKLTVPWLISAYRSGIFPWFDEGQPILWWSPTPRMVLFTDKFHTSRSFKKFLNKSQYQIRVNQEFSQVIRQCAQMRKDDPGTWITEMMIHAYIQMHEAGYAHSFECYDQDEQLVGGLYGVAIGQVFFGESMFSKADNASKYCLKYLAETGLYKLIDCQMETPHLISLGAVSISRELFELQIKRLINSV